MNLAGINSLPKQAQTRGTVRKRIVQADVVLNARLSSVTRTWQRVKTNVTILSHVADTLSLRCSLCKPAFKKKNVPNHDMALRRLADMLTLAGIVSGLVGGNARVHSRDFTVPHALHF